LQFFCIFPPKWYIFPQYSFNKMSNVILDLDSIWVSIFILTVISLFSKEITVHSGVVWRDKIYGDRHQICEWVEVSTMKYQLFTQPKTKYLLFTLYFNLNVCCHISCPSTSNLIPRACDPQEGTSGSGIICCRKPGILAKGHVTRCNFSCTCNAILLLRDVN
jgi:hypothetical protein